MKVFPHGAFVRLLSTVLCKVGPAVESLPTLHALTGPLPRMDHMVLKEASALNKSFSTLDGFIRLHSRMDPLISCEKVFFVKNLPTFITFEDIFLFLYPKVFPRYPGFIVRTAAQAVMAPARSLHTYSQLSLNRVQGASLQKGLALS